MKFSLYVFLLIGCVFSSCKLMHKDLQMPDNPEFGKVLNDYYEDQLKYFPLAATQNGDNRYNDQLPVDFTDRYFDTLRNFYDGYLSKILVFDRNNLSRNDQVSYDVFVREMQMNREALDLHLSLNPATMPNIQYIPFNQFEGVPLLLGQMGSGGGIQPFHSVSDYENWITRAGKFQAWSDSAIVYFRKGLDNGYILPRCLVEKMIPEMQNMVVPDITQSVFYAPIQQMPASFAEADKQKITSGLSAVITNVLEPSYKKLADFLQNEYLPKSRSSIGFAALPNGKNIYHFLIRYWTTTNKTADEIYQTGLSEVKRIREEMERTRAQTGFKGDLPSLFAFMKNDPQFMPYKTPGEVLDAYKKIQLTIDSNLPKFFSHTPKMKFEIHQTEAFRAASASAEYVQGDPEASGPAYFMCPFWMPQNTIRLPEWNLFSCMKPFRVIIIKVLYNWKTVCSQNSGGFYGMVLMVKAGRCIQNRWARNSGCIRIHFSI